MGTGGALQEVPVQRGVPPARQGQRPEEAGCEDVGQEPGAQEGARGAQGDEDREGQARGRGGARSGALRGELLLRALCRGATLPVLDTESRVRAPCSWWRPRSKRKARKK